jgi:hypothetical protein
MIFAEVRAKTGPERGRRHHKGPSRFHTAAGCASERCARRGRPRSAITRNSACWRATVRSARTPRLLPHTIRSVCTPPPPHASRPMCITPQQISRGSVERTCALALMQRRPTPGLDTARGVPLRATLFSNRSTAMVRPRAPRPSPRRFAWRPHPAPRLLTDRLGQRYAGADESLERRAE